MLGTIIGIVVLVLILVALALYFWSSGAMVIQSGERELIEKETPEQLAKDIAQEEQQEIDEEKKTENEFYSHG